jgi:citrate synthase
MSGTTSEAKPRGLDGVVAAQTRLSHVDGQNGVLIIGGYELKELAGKVTFEEAAHLLWKGRLPSADEREDLTRAIAAQRALPENTMDIVREAAKKGAPPIDTLRMACATLSLDMHNPNDISPGADFDNAKMLVARFPR